MRPPHGPVDPVVWRVAASICGDHDDLWRGHVVRLGMPAATVVLAAAVLRHGSVPFLRQRAGTALRLFFGLVMTRGDRAWGDPRLGLAAGSGLFAAISVIAWLAVPQG